MTRRSPAAVRARTQLRRRGEQYSDAATSRDRHQKRKGMQRPSTNRRTRVRYNGTKRISVRIAIAVGQQRLGVGVVATFHQFGVRGTSHGALAAGSNKHRRAGVNRPGHMHDVPWSRCLKREKARRKYKAARGVSLTAPIGPQIDCQAAGPTMQIRGIQRIARRQISSNGWRSPWSRGRETPPTAKRKVAHGDADERMRGGFFGALF